MSIALEVPTNNTLYYADEGERIISQRSINATVEYHDGSANYVRVVHSNTPVLNPLIERISEINGKTFKYHTTIDERVTDPVEIDEVTAGSSFLGFLTILAYLIAMLLIIFV